jgi:hypothetical protein
MIKMNHIETEFPVRVAGKSFSQVIRILVQFK